MHSQLNLSIIFICTYCKHLFSPQKIQTINHAFNNQTFPIQMESLLIIIKGRFLERANVILLALILCNIHTLTVIPSTFISLNLTTFILPLDAMRYRAPSKPTAFVLFLQNQFCFYVVFWHNKSTQLVNITGFNPYTRCTCSSHSEDISVSWGLGTTLESSTLSPKSSGSGST